MPASYARRIRSVLSAGELKTFRRLSSPWKIQDFIDSLAINMERDVRTYMSPRRVLASGQAHCVEGALLAAAALAFHGERPLLLDFQAAYDDEDHVVALFRANRHWGAISGGKIALSTPAAKQPRIRARAGTRRVRTSGFRSASPAESRGSSEPDAG